MYTRRVLLLLIAALAGLGLSSAQAPGRRFLIVLIGPTGSGKTTQSEFLKKEYGIPTVNIDDLIKENPGALAKYDEPGIDPGVPQSNPAISELVADRLSKLDLSKEWLSTVIRRQKIRPIISRVWLRNSRSRRRS